MLLNCHLFSTARASAFQPLRRRGARDDPAAAPAEPADDAADGADDRGRVQVGRGAVVAAGHQVAQVEGGEQRRRYQGQSLGEMSVSMGQGCAVSRYRFGRTRIEAVFWVGIGFGDTFVLFRAQPCKHNRCDAHKGRF